MADLFDTNLQLDSDYTYSTNYPNLVQPPVTNVFTGDVNTIVTTVNGASGPNITISAAPATGYVFNGTVLQVNNAATVRSSISAAQSGINTDITQLNGASQVDVSSHYEVSGTQVVGAQQAAIANPVGGVTIDAEARAQLILLLNAARAHGLIDT